MAERSYEAKGTVDFFNDTGGYGFIESDQVDEDVFFHMEDIEGPDLKEGQSVEFDIERAKKGPRVDSLRRVDEDVYSSDEIEDNSSDTETKVFASTSETGDDQSEPPNYCPSCGERIDAQPGDSFCSYCGYEL